VRQIQHFIAGCPWEFTHQRQRSLRTEFGSAAMTPIRISTPGCAWLKAPASFFLANSA
jgi:hypothetical protein